MKRRWMLLPIICFGVIGWAQDSAELQPAPGDTAGVLGPRLIAWSELQKPQPVPRQPQPVPPPDTRPGNEPSEQNPPRDTQRSPQPQTSESAAQTVTGSIVKVAGKYMLETEDNIAYQLDDQEKAKQYEGKRVKVTGALDRTTGIFHVANIELLS